LTDQIPAIKIAPRFLRQAINFHYCSEYSLMRDDINSSAKGNVSESKVLTAFVQSGWQVLLPFGTGCRYDLAVDDGVNLVRVQVKTGRLRKGCVIFAAYSTNGSKGSSRRRNYKGKADLFAVYCPDNDKIYLVPVEKAAVEGRLRVHPPGNNQKNKVHWACDYEFDMASIAQLVRARDCGSRGRGFETLCSPSSFQ
jgi:PD-(D/E)XK endonuclease